MKMLELSLAGNPHFKMDTRDLARPGVSYTVDTLREMRRELRTDAELFFILGVDALKGFSSWKEPGEIIRLCTLVVVPRPGRLLPRVAALEKEVPGMESRLIVLTGPRIGISAEDIRERVRQGKTIQYLVPPAVSGYIKQHRLYLTH